MFPKCVHRFKELWLLQSYWLQVCTTLYPQRFLRCFVFWSLCEVQSYITLLICIFCNQNVGASHWNCTCYSVDLHCSFCLSHGWDGCWCSSWHWNETTDSESVYNESQLCVKVASIILLSRLALCFDEISVVVLCWFWCNWWSTTDQIFCAHQILGKKWGIMEHILTDWLWLHVNLRII